MPKYNAHRKLVKTKVIKGKQVKGNGLVTEDNYVLDYKLSYRLKNKLVDVIDDQINQDEKSKVKKQRALMVINSKIEKEHEQVDRKY